MRTLARCRLCLSSLGASGVLNAWRTCRSSHRGGSRAQQEPQEPFLPHPPRACRARGASGRAGRLRLRGGPRAVCSLRAAWWAAMATRTRVMILGGSVVQQPQGTPSKGGVSGRSEYTDCCVVCWLCGTRMGAFRASAAAARQLLTAGAAPWRMNVLCHAVMDRVMERLVPSVYNLTCTRLVVASLCAPCRDTVTDKHHPG